MTKKLAAHPACTSPVSVAALVSILIRAPFFGCADGGSQTCFSFVLETEREKGEKKKRGKWQVVSFHLCKSFFDLCSPVSQGSNVDAQVVISWGRSDREGMPVTDKEQSVWETAIFLITIWVYICIHYHSKFDTSGHLTNRYIPLLYLNPGGLVMYSARTFPVYIVACRCTKNRWF